MQNKNAKILIVDDLTENLIATKVTLAPLEVEIHTANSGNEALTMMLKHEYAVVLLDVQMPYMDGFEAASLMQNNAVTRGVPIIFVTAINKENEHVFRGYEAGAVDYLFKPVNPDILLSKVKVFINLYNTRIECEKMHDELQKARNLESLGLLAGGIAHDFNNILAAIMGNIDLVMLNMGQEETQSRKLLANAEKAVVRAKDLTYQLLTFSKGGDPVKTITSIETIIKESANFVLHGSNVKCNYDFPEDLWPAEVDSGQVGQVIQNIVINAIQAMPNGGLVDLCCRNFENERGSLLPMQEGKYVEIKITDNGVGIDQELIDKIFDPYMTTKQEGNGLGLSITHSIVKKHGGHIQVDSSPGKGTTFLIFLPASKSPLKIVKNIEVATITYENKGTVMVMDDDEMIRNMSMNILKRTGYDVLLAEDGVRAIDLFKESLDAGKVVDLIIMDLTIPGGMGGKEAVVEIHKMDPKAKVVVSSGYSNDQVMANFGQFGFCASIVKPYQLTELLGLVGRLLA